MKSLPIQVEEIFFKKNDIALFQTINLLFIKRMDTINKIRVALASQTRLGRMDREIISRVKDRNTITT